MAPEDQQLLTDPSAEATWEYLVEKYPDFRLTPDTSLSLDLGLDSLAWVNLSLTLRDRVGVEFDDDAIGRIETVRDLLREAAGAGQSEGTAEGPATWWRNCAAPSRMYPRICSAGSSRAVP